MRTLVSTLPGNWISGAGSDAVWRLRTPNSMRRLRGMTMFWLRSVVYSRLMPVFFRRWLLERGIELVEVPEDEFGTMGANVLAVAPRRCVMLADNPHTRARLEKAGAEVRVYTGDEISVKGGGGPTCLTRPLVRASA